MSKSKYIDHICIAVIAVTLVITILFMCGEKLGIAVIHREEDENTSEMFTGNDLDADWDTSSATKIVLKDNTAEISGNGAYFNDGTLQISYAGRYVLSGSLSGSVEVDADGDDKIWLLLDGVNITSQETAPLYIKQADKTFVTLQSDSENSLVFQCTDEEATVDGAIYSKDDLTVNGDGSLCVVSDALHGIVCNDTLVLSGGRINISAGKDAVHAHDAIKICSASLSVSAGDDGLHAGNDTETAVFYLESGDIDITECYEGIEANTITIAGGTVNITPSDDGLNANGSGEASLITISGGDIAIINTAGRDADGLDSNGSIEMTGGNVFVSLNGNGTNNAIDYGSENGGTCRISGGTLIACGSSGMAECPEQDSEQGFIMQNVSGSANQLLSVCTTDGTEILSKEIPCAYTSVVLSSPEIVVGDTYVLTVGDTSTRVTVDNASVSGGDMGGGNTGGNMGGGNMGGNMGGMGGMGGGFQPNGNMGGTPPEKPDGDNGSASQPPEMPGDDTGTIPEMPGDSGNAFQASGDAAADSSTTQSAGKQDGDMGTSKPGNSEKSGNESTAQQSENTDNSSESETSERKEFANGDHAQMPGGEHGNRDSAQQTDTTESTIDTSTWIWLGASALALLIGLLIVIKKKF